MNHSQNNRLAFAILQTCLFLLAVFLHGDSIYAVSHVVPGSVQSAMCRVFNQTGRQQDIGSGTLVEKTVDGRQGLVLTCWHLFRDGTGNIVVEFPDGRTHGAKLIHLDAQADLAALVIANPRPEPVKIRITSGQKSSAGSEQSWFACGYGATGQYRCAIGPVVGESQSTGQHSVLLRDPVRSGDSGGGLFDAQGRLVGVVWGESQGVTYASCGRPLRRFLDRVLRRQSGVRVCPDGRCPLQPEAGSGTTRLDSDGMEDLERQIAELRQEKQDRGEYLTREQLQRFQDASTARHESLLQRLGAISSAGGSGLGHAAGTAAVGLLGISGPAGWAAIAAGSLGGWLLGRRLKKKRGAGGRRSQIFRQFNERTNQRG